MDGCVQVSGAMCPRCDVEVWLAPDGDLVCRTPGCPGPRVVGVAVIWPQKERQEVCDGDS
jgi:hypothetical protein